VLVERFRDINTGKENMTTQIAQDRGVSRAVAQGIASGILVLTFFGAYWGIISAIFLGGAAQIIFFALVGVVTLGFGGLGGMLLRQARTMPKQQSPGNAVERKRLWSGYGIVVGTEVALIALASVLLSLLQEGPYIAPITALIVGIHFFPLAQLFRVPLYWITGILLSILALIALAALIFGWTWTGSAAYRWSLVVGIGTTLILWMTLLGLTWMGWQLIRQRR